MIGWKSFLSTKKERRSWHRGIYKGLWKYWNPRTMLRKEIPTNGFLTWEEKEQQYEDTIMIAIFISKYYGIIGLLYFANELGVLKELLALVQVMFGG